MAGDGAGAVAARDWDWTGDTTAEALTPREREVLGLLVLGCTVNQAAQRLRVAPSTVQSHVKSIYGKTGAHSRAQVVIAALRLGLLGR